MTINRLDGPGVPPRPENVEGGRNPRADKGISRSEGGDRIQLSPEVREIAALAESARALPEVRQEKVEALRQELKQGTYEVDARRLAEVLLESEDELGG